jgi:radical SAM protein with 4Fe4S-binding SPASM domain
MRELFIDGSKLMHHLDRLNDWRQGKTFFPVHVEISPSSACNQRCILCCVDFLKHKPAFLSREIFLSLVDEFSKYGVKSFLLAGEGEPLLNKHIVEFIVKSSQNGIDSALNSNAVLLGEEISKEIFPHLTWARFTMQSHDPQKYSRIHGTSENDYYKAVENISNAVELKRKNDLDVTLGIQQILIKENWEDIFELAKLAKNLGVDYFTVKRFSKHSKNTYDVPENMFKRCLQQFRRCDELSDNKFKSLVRRNQFETQCIRTYARCIGLPFITQILANGGVYPCIQYFGVESKCFGNLNQQSLTEIWLSERKSSIMDDIEKNTNVNDCMTYCRHHSTNLFLWQFLEPPPHINFI